MVTYITQSVLPDLKSFSLFIDLFCRIVLVIVQCWKQDEDKDDLVPL